MLHVSFFNCAAFLSLVFVLHNRHARELFDFVFLIFFFKGRNNVDRKNGEENRKLDRDIQALNNAMKHIRSLSDSHFKNVVTYLSPDLDDFENDLKQLSVNWQDSNIDRYKWIDNASFTEWLVYQTFVELPDKVSDFSKTLWKKLIGKEFISKYKKGLIRNNQIICSSNNNNNNNRYKRPYFDITIKEPPINLVTASAFRRSLTTNRIFEIEIDTSQSEDISMDASILLNGENLFNLLTETSEIALRVVSCVLWDKLTAYNVLCSLIKEPKFDIKNGQHTGKQEKVVALSKITNKQTNSSSNNSGSGNKNNEKHNNHNLKKLGNHGNVENDNMPEYNELNLVSRVSTCTRARG